MTGDFYGMGHKELLIREGLASRNRGKLLPSVKFGALRDPAQGWTGYDARPAAVKNFATAGSVAGVARGVGSGVIRGPTRPARQCGAGGCRGGRAVCGCADRAFG
jgi:hypothetical protein